MSLFVSDYTRNEGDSYPIKKRESFWDGMELVKSYDKGIPYRLIKGDVDYTPVPFKKKKHSDIEEYIDMADFISLFRTDNFFPNELILDYSLDTSQIIQQFHTRLDCYKDDSLLYNELKLSKKNKSLQKVTQLENCQSIFVTQEPTILKTFKIFLLETDTIELFFHESLFIDLQKEPENNIFIYGKQFLAKFQKKKPLEEPETRQSTTASKIQKTESFITPDTTINAGNHIEGTLEPTNVLLLPESEKKDSIIEEQPVRLSNFSSQYKETGKETKLFRFRSIDTTMQPLLPRDVKVNTDEVKLKHQLVATSPSMIYESYKESEFQETIKKKIEDHRLLKTEFASISTCVLDSEVFDFVLRSVERILEYYYYHREQMILRYEHFNDDVCLNHNLSCLLSLKVPKNCSKNNVQEVTSLSWNPVNRNLLAVGYGKVHLEKKAKGMVCIWNLKNPSFPERVYEFKNPVTSIAFCEIYPYALAVAFCNGHLAIINILIKKLIIIADTFKLMSNYLPITHLSWFKDDNGDYFPVTSSKTGDIYRYRMKNEFVPELLVQLPPRDSDENNAENYSCYFAHKVSISTFAQHPTDPFTYLVGTTEGYIHFCSTLYKLQDLYNFSAHKGPINSIEFHHKTDKLFLTSGSDYYIKVWGYKICEPLLSFSARKEFTRGAKWCQFNPMLIISMSEKFIDVWDLRRVNDTIPLSTCDNPDHESYLTFNISPFRWNLMVGDVTGCVYIFTLHEIKNELDYSMQMLAKILRNHIECRNPSLWMKVEELLPEFRIENNGQCASEDPRSDNL